MEMNAEKKNSMDIWNETQPFEGNSLALSFGKYIFI